MSIAMAVSVMAMTSGAEAGFLYVPPGEPAAVVEAERARPPEVERAPTAHEHGGTATTRTDRIDAHRSETPRRVAAPLRAATPLRAAAPLRVATPRYADAEPLEKSGSLGLWQVRAGEMLREALDRWGDRAGVEVLFLTDRRYRLHEGRAFPGSFDEAARTLFSALSHLPHPPAGELRPDGRTLAVMHGLSGMRPAGDGR
ncbi:MAG: TcpQ domain-containing protein [Alphaproteobacteria bacterium]|nr:TcpQ domain-containing protein [Alphaproteobacteria bacterium]